METTSRRIFIDRFHLERLRLLLQTQGDLGAEDKATLKALSEDLEEARIITDGEDIPKVVTMNSRVRLRDLATNRAEDLRLVFPGKSSKGLGKLSVLTPEGAAILGVQEQQTVTVPAPEGPRLLQVESIQ